MSEVFRDRTEGALARRQDLLRKRRDELVTMPHAIRRAVVARAARAAAATAMIAAGGAMLAVALSPALAAQIGRGMPGINPAVISTFVAAAWIVGLVAWATSRARSEHRFAVEMMRYVLPGADLDDDIERLSHEHPDEVARRMAHGLEIRSAALPLLAAGLVAPATLIYVAHAWWTGGWPSTADYELDLVACAKPLAISAAVGAVVALAMTRPALRAPAVRPLMTAIALITGALAIAALVERATGWIWILTITSVMSGAISYVNRCLARERTAIEATDPAEGSELWTVRGLVAQARGAAGFVRARVSARMAVATLAFATLLVCAGGPIATTAPTAGAVVPHQIQPPANKLVVDESTYTTLPTGDGRLRIAVTIRDGMPVEIPGLSGQVHVPTGWKARIALRLETSTLPAAVVVTPFADDPSVVPLHMQHEGDEHRFASEACAERPQSLGLQIIPATEFPAGTYHATFLVEPSLELANCQ
jgi:hypothetical protein